MAVFFQSMALCEYQSSFIVLLDGGDALLTNLVHREVLTWAKS